MFPNIQHLCDVGKYFGYIGHMGKFVVIVLNDDLFSHKSCIVELHYYEH